MKARYEGVCSYCGREGLHVKRNQQLCRACYARLQNNGTVEITPSAYAIGSKPDGWRLIHVEKREGARPHYHFMCEYCGRIAVHSDHVARQIVYGNYHPCKCSINYFPRTEKQKRIVDLYIELGYSESKVADEIGISRQAVSQALKSCKRPTRRAVYK